MIGTEQKESYRRDGVVCLRNVITEQWREVSRRGVETSVANPGRFFRDYTAEGSPARYVFEYWNWWNIPEFEDLAFNSNIAALVAELLDADKLTLLMDQWFLREAGATNGASWHHDEPYFDFFGGRKCVVWFPLEETSAEEGLTFLAGSHNWGKLFMAQNFGKREAFDGDTSGYETIGDFDRYADSLLSWDMVPGDCLFFDFRTLHRATSDTTPLSRTSHRISYRYGDQDVIFRPRGAWTEETSAFIMEAGQKADAKLDCKLLPTVFERAAA